MTTITEATKRPILETIRFHGVQGVHDEFETCKKTTTKAHLVDLVTRLCQELELTYQYEVRADARKDNLLDEREELKRDLACVGNHADKMRDLLEREVRNHTTTKQQAARALHGSAVLFGKASPVVADEPREDRGPIAQDIERLMERRSRT